MIQASLRRGLSHQRRTAPSVFRRFLSNENFSRSFEGSFQSFADLVSRGFKVVHLTDSCELDPKHVDTEKITKFVIKPVDAFPFDENGLEVWSLPPGRGYSWPVMNTVKQTYTIGRNLLFRRTDQASLGRETDAMKSLVEERGAIWLGVTGIGKSMAATAMLTHALRMVQRQADGESESDRFEDLDIFGEDKNGGFAELYYRQGMVPVQVVREGKQFKVKTLSMKSFADLAGFEYYNRPPDKRRVLIAEINDGEEHPREPGLYTGSSRVCISNRKDRFKKLVRAGHFDFIIEPPPPEVLVAMYRAIKQLDGQDLPAHIQREEDFLKLLADIGPIPRYLFCPDVDAIGLFKSRRIAAAKKVFREIRDDHNDCDYSTCTGGKYVPYLLGPFLRRGVKLPGRGFCNNEENAVEYLQTLTEEQRAKVLGKFSSHVHEVRPLSMSAQLLLDKNISCRFDLEFLAGFGRSSDVLEATIRCAGTYNPSFVQSTDTAHQPVSLCHERSLDLSLVSLLDQRSKFDEWKWYNGEHGENLLSARTETAHAHPMCDREIFFDPTPVHSAYNGPHKVWQMKPHVLYRPSPHHLFSEIEYFFVDHARRLVVAHMVTVASLNEHPLSIDALDETMTNLGLFEDEGRQYSLLIVGVNDQTVTQPTGLVFKRKQQGTMKEEDAKGLAAWRRDGSWEHAHRVKAAVALVSVFNFVKDDPYRGKDVKWMDWVLRHAHLTLQQLNQSDWMSIVNT